MNYTFVKTEDNEKLILVPVSTDKPEIPEKTLKKWQRIVNIVAAIMNVPTGLITRLTKEHLEIFVASETEGNPYRKNDRDNLGIGMFCETVAGHRRKMVVDNTDDSDYWRNNPHAHLGMHSYLGVPISWGDGELFGTFCMLNDQRNKFRDEFHDLMNEFKEIIETDLQYIQMQKELENRLSVSELYVREIHHRVKNHFNLLISLINLQSRENKGDTEEVLMDLQNRIRAISAVHEKLQTSPCCRMPMLGDYIRQLSTMIEAGTASQNVSFSFEIDDLTVGVDDSVPLGLILSELISNSLKYAFPGVISPEIKITIKDRERGKLFIEYRDNGCGYPEELDTSNPDSLGISLIKLLTSQLGGTMNIKNDEGAVYTAELLCSSISDSRKV